MPLIGQPPLQQRIWQGFITIVRQVDQVFRGNRTSNAKHASHSLGWCRSLPRQNVRGAPVFEADCTECSRPTVPYDKVGQSGTVAFNLLGRTATIFCIIMMKRVWSALLRASTVSRCAARADASILRSNVAPALVSRQVCDRRS